MKKIKFFGIPIFLVLIGVLLIILSFGIVSIFPSYYTFKKLCDIKTYSDGGYIQGSLCPPNDDSGFSFVYLNKKGIGQNAKWEIYFRMVDSNGKTVGNPLLLAQPVPQPYGKEAKLCDFVKGKENYCLLYSVEEISEYDAELKVTGFYVVIFTKDKVIGSTKTHSAIHAGQYKWSVSAHLCFNENTDEYTAFFMQYDYDFFDGLWAYEIKKVSYGTGFSFVQNSLTPPNIDTANWSLSEVIFNKDKNEYAIFFKQNDYSKISIMKVDSDFNFSDEFTVDIGDEIIGDNNLTGIPVSNFFYNPSNKCYEFGVVSLIGSPVYTDVDATTLHIVKINEENQVSYDEVTVNVPGSLDIMNKDNAKVYTTISLLYNINNNAYIFICDYQPFKTMYEIKNNQPIEIMSWEAIKKMQLDMKEGILTPKGLSIIGVHYEILMSDEKVYAVVIFNLKKFKKSNFLKKLKYYNYKF